MQRTVLILIAVLGCSAAPKAVPANRTSSAAAATEGVQYVGDPNASVALTYYFDYVCPHCVEFSASLDEIERKYGNRIVVHYRNFQLARHPEARLAAIAAEAARRQGKYIEMHRLLFRRAAANQPTPEQMLAALQQGQQPQPTFTPGVLRDLAASLDLDLARYDRDVQDASAARRVDAEYAEGDKRGLDGVPQMFIGNARYDGDLELGSLSAAIDAQLR